MKRSFAFLAVIAALAAAFAMLRRASPPSIPVDAAAVAPSRATAAPVNDESLPGATITGRVTDDAHTPIAGAQVCGYPRSRRLSTAATAPRCVPTAADGTYVLASVVPATYAVGASAEGFLAATWKAAEETSFPLAAGETRAGVDLVLGRGGIEIRGHVKDLTGGSVPRARVVIGRGHMPADAVGQTDEAGDFRAWVAPGYVVVDASADGYTSGRTSVTVPGQRIEVTLTPESVLQGRVVEAGTETPVAGARVSPSRERPGPGEEIVAMTDADGRFRLRGLQPGRYKPVAISGAGWGTIRESVVLGLAETTDVVIPMHPALSVGGTVVGPDGKGCPRPTLLLQDRKTGETRFGEGDAQGAVRVDGVLPGTFKVTPRCEGLLTPATFDDVVLGASSLASLVWKLEAGFAVRGTVVTAAGAPIPHARVRAISPAKDSFGSAPPQAWSADDGRFVLRGLARGPYALEPESVSATASEVPISVVVDRDLDGVKLTMQASAPLEGSVVDTTGAPVEVEVLARGNSEKTAFRSERTRDDGTFSFRSLPAGEYHVSAEGARAPGTKDDDVQGTAVTTKAGTTTKVRLTVEARNGEIHGRVKDDQGNAVSDAFVDAERESDRAGAGKGYGRAAMRWDWGDRSPVVTDNDGAFTIGKLAVGSYIVRAYRKGGGDTFEEHVGTGSDVTLVIRTEGTISGTIVDANGKAPERFSIVVRDPKQSFNRNESFFRTEGTWTMSHLPEGDLAISGTTADGRALAELHLAAGEKKDGIRLVVEASGTIKGQLVALEDGKPVPGLIVVPFPAKGGGGNLGMATEKRIVSDVEGRFEVRASPGKLVVRTFTDAMPGNWATATVSATVGPGGVTELPPIKVARTRTKGGIEGDLGFATQEPAVGEDPTATIHGHVVMVRPGSAAATGGLVVGDDIVSVDGYAVEGPNAYLYPALTQVSPGTKLTLGVRRGATITLTASGPPGPKR